MGSAHALDVGDMVSDLALALSSDRSARLGDYSAQWLVVYFYPKDATPGCTTEGIEFNALLDKFKRRRAIVLGVSRDSLKSHRNFCAKQGFRFELVSDTDEALCQAFGVIKLKNMYGKQVRGIERSTFLIAPGGRIAQAWRGVRVPGHAQAVLDAIPAK